jgi:hypothetical protein
MILNAENSMKKIFAAFISRLVAFIILMLFIGPVLGQEEQTAVNLTFTTWKYSDGTRTLVSKITATDSIGEVPAEGLEMRFFNPSEKEENLIGSVKTGADGKAVLSIAPSAKLISDKDGVMKFVCRFDGTPKYESSEADISVKDARIEIGFAEVDSVRKITYNGVVKNAKGEELPLANMDVLLYVPRMFSMLKVVDGWLEEDGEGESDFPGDLIGDSAGVVKIYARIEENPDFGNLEAEGVTNWAITKHNEKREGPQRELWTPIAPLWMIITLIIMLTGVWAHYIYAIVQLVLINRDGKKHKEKPT